jgi:hypothetical protein
MSRKAEIAARLPVRRGLDENEAAVYLSLSPTMFRSLVKAGEMPRPRIIHGRRVYDIDDLDLAFKTFPKEDSPGGCRELDTWADVR